MQYMRAHGNTPGPTQRPVAAGVISAAELDGGLSVDARRLPQVLLRLRRCS